MIRWERWENGEAEGGRYLVLFKGRGHKMSPRFHVFVSDVNQGNDGMEWAQDFLVWLQG